MSEKKILTVDENNKSIAIPVKDSKDCVRTIIKEYEKYADSMNDILASIEIQGFNTEEVINIYAECVYLSDGDITVRFRDEENFDMDLFKKEEILGL